MTSQTGSEISGNEVKAEKFTKLEKLYTVLILIAAFGYVEFEIFSPTGIITTAVNFLIITLAIVFLKKNDCKFNFHNTAIAGVMYIFSCVFSITDNGFIKFLNAVFLFLLGAYFVYSAGEGRKNIERYLPFAMIKALFEFPINHFGIQALAVKESIGKTRSAGNIKYIFLGLLLTVPLTAIVALLLISADEGMENIFKEINNTVFSGKIIKYFFHFIIAIPCGMYLYGMIYGNGKRKDLNVLNGQLCEEKINAAKVIPNMVLYTAILPILVLYVIFFISQANYFLSAFSGALPEGYSYAEYARRGFFELCAITIINLGVIIFISMFARNSGKSKSGMLKFYTVVLSLFTMILIAVAVSKMIMYISEYGLTRLRFYTTWFMVLCAFIFILIIVKQFRFEMNFAGCSLTIFTLMFGLLCFSCPDRAIAKYNVEMYKAGYLKDIDKSEIQIMSDDAVLYAIEEGLFDKNDSHYLDHLASQIKSENYIYRLNLSSFILYEELKDMKTSEEEMTEEFKYFAF